MNVQALGAGPGHQYEHGVIDKRLDDLEAKTEYLAKEYRKKEGILEGRHWQIESKYNAIRRRSYLILGVSVFALFVAVYILGDNGAALIAHKERISEQNLRDNTEMKESLQAIAETLEALENRVSTLEQKAGNQ